MARSIGTTARGENGALYRAQWHDVALRRRLAPRLPLLTLAALAPACAATPRLALRLGFGPEGAATPEWRQAVEAHTGRRPSWEPRPLPAEEEAWLALVRARLAAWEARLPELGLAFEGVSPPPVTTLVVGHSHGEDGFGLGEAVIYFDLAALARNYGTAAEAGNAARLERIFAHEYTHVLHWRWARAHPQPVATPLERALWAMAREGLGNLRSLSEAWVGPRGTPTPLARQTLARLEPVLVERLAALEHATPEREPELVRGLSSGPFREKWGALPVALWLAQESRGDERALRPFVESGAAGVLALARRHLAPELAARLPSEAPSEARALAGPGFPR